MVTRARTFLTASLVVGPLGCIAAELPGDRVGKYAIASTLEDNSCGLNALPTPGSLDYMVELRREQGTGYWLVGRPPATVGLLSAEGRFQFETEQTYQVREPREALPALVDMDPLALYRFDPEDEPSEAAEPECTLVIRERQRGQVLRDEADFEGGSDAGGGIADLTGENTIQMSAAPGSQCARVLQQNGGPFEALPCSATYALEGALIEPDDD